MFVPNVFKLSYASFNVYMVYLQYLDELGEYNVTSDVRRGDCVYMLPELIICSCCLGLLNINTLLLA